MRDKIRQIFISNKDIKRIDSFPIGNGAKVIDIFAGNQRYSIQLSADQWEKIKKNLDSNP